MKKFTLSFAATACALLLTAGVAGADGHLAGAVKARQALMQIYAFNIGQLGAMAKGEVAYDAKTAAVAAANLATAATINQGAMWQQGSDNGAMGDKTRALPEIWTTYPAIAEKGKALNEAVGALAKVAGTDLAGLRSAIGGVGKACGGCHKQFRAEKK